MRITTAGEMCVMDREAIYLTRKRKTGDKMKKIICIFLFILMLAGCGGGGGKSDAVSGGVNELELGGDPVAETIGSEQDVDVYHVRANTTNGILSINCDGYAPYQEVDLLVTVYEDEVAAENRLFADHAAENSAVTPKIDINLFIDEPKDIYITVRDLKDDDASLEEPYHISVHLSDSVADNDDLTNATTISGYGSEAAVEEQIDYVGDVDCFAFSAPNEGVYGINVDYSPYDDGTNKTKVALKVKLYDPDGDLIQSLANIQGNQFRMLSYLSGSNEPYHIVIEDIGKNDFDELSPFTVWVDQLDVAETFDNDSEASAQPLTYDAALEGFLVSGSLDYSSAEVSDNHGPDKDVYAMALDGIATVGDIKVLRLTLQDGDTAQNFNYQVSMLDGSGETIMTHDFIGGADPYECQVKAGAGTHYLVLQPADQKNLTQRHSYSATVKVIGIEDADEQGNGNNTESNATALTAGVSREAKISYRGDVDFYEIEVPTDVPKVLSMYLDSSESLVAYQMQLLTNQVLKTVLDKDGSDAPTQLKTSVYISDMPAATTTFYVKVCDFQNDNGDDVPYTLLVTVDDIPTQAQLTGAPAGDLVYFSEIAEENLASDEMVEVEVEIAGHFQPLFNASTAIFDFRAADLAAKGIVMTPAVPDADDTVTIELPWIAGFVDYQGDRDLFQLNLDHLLEAAPENDAWYYDIQIQLVAAGSDVEYVWQMYRDTAPQGVFHTDRYFAAYGDMDLGANAIDLMAPDSGSSDDRLSDDFFVGSRWSPGSNPIYLMINDFNYITDPSTGQDNPNPDDDWGYDAPYYFKVTLTYHPGEDEP
jgi:hypothetical protein